MEITVSQAEGNTPITVLELHGELDGSNYRDLIYKAQEVYDSGTRAMLVDMRDTPFISSAGVVALHTIAKILSGMKADHEESGWESFRDIDRDRDNKQQGLKLLGPQPRVYNVLEMVGFTNFFEIFTDFDEAIASFS